MEATLIESHDQKKWNVMDRQSSLLNKAGIGYKPLNETQYEILLALKSTNDTHSAWQSIKLKENKAFEWKERHHWRHCTLRDSPSSWPNSAKLLVGCSVFSSRQPAGIAGFGRGPSSLPSQIGLSKFSYCLLSHKFDDSAESSSLVLDSEFDSDKKTTALVYTPLLKNPKVEKKPAFSVYYYVGLRRIIVGGRRVKIPYKYLSPGNDGNGGTIIDSGTTFTFMSHEGYEALSNEFISQMKNYERAETVEDLSGLKPCFNVSGVMKVEFPELKLHFKGGTEVLLPVENYFALVGDREVACLTVVTDVVEGAEAAKGPGIILGNFLMQNFLVEYDLRNERLGFRRDSCK
ncbi:hypothetical protein GH714_016198 [Hevea brasiliensis]|uniref:Peptidase A1 domain-containing protein n=1 Tax=Hevea brasiliensis TaxID=3981 RepID=A0A6A6MDX1_HEVBR|nr:hypothetical protein GH714_016198 [Hevea brasiliensis]